jgi:branched-chain amino acid transport system ATP-binding protein
MLTGIIAPDDGVIRFEGRDIGGVAAHRRARLGIVRAFQIPRPFAQLSVYENVLTAALYGAGLSGARAQRLAVEVLNTTGFWRTPTNPRGIFAYSTASGSSWRRRSHRAPSFCCSMKSRAD